MWSTQLFDPGLIVTTPGVSTALEHLDPLEWMYLIIRLVTRHITGDWGDLDIEDRTANDHAVILGERVLSAYHLPDGTKVWVITEADRSVTTVLLPDEY
jgi:hypothetical protein